MENKKINRLLKRALKRTIKVYSFSACSDNSEFLLTQSPRFNLGEDAFVTICCDPSEADVLLVLGAISKKMEPVLKDVYSRMGTPKWVMAVANDYNSDSYATVDSIEQIVPISYYFNSPNPTPIEILDGIKELQSSI